MTASTDNDRRQASDTVTPSIEQPCGHHPVMPAVKLFAGVTAVAGAGCLAAAFSVAEWRIALAGSTLVVLSAVASALWIADGLLADRHAFYRRGKVDGWYEGWRGQPPATDDPLLRRS
ncbi:hypothetical protein ACQPZX_41275 [Actinoplanes sp. CA-142083]|uniref:hypothetical protein n=1 Tax=Actinoplanes sp. CA-142083 TaxID=3239903 RepID=UPI003D920996